MSPTPLVFGTTSVHSRGSFSTPEKVAEVLAAARQAGITTIDTAQLYGDSETVLGASGVDGFTLDTKTPAGFIPDSLEPAKLASDARRSVSLLGVDKLDVFYIHSPDPTGKYPLEQTLEVLNSLHAEGVFNRLGLSNFTAAETETAHAACIAHGWVPPTVFQGNYSAFARHAEAELLPTLRRLGMAFYAYSPLAGGFLARRAPSELFGDDGGRFSRSGERGFALYQGLYSERPKLVGALERWARVADEAGCESPAELGYRWIASNSALDAELGDKVVIGSSRIGHVPQVAGWVAKGPLGAETVKAINELWEEIKDEAPLDNWHK